MGVDVGMDNFAMVVNVLNRIEIRNLIWESARSRIVEKASWLAVVVLPSREWVPRPSRSEFGVQGSGYSVWTNSAVGKPDTCYNTVRVTLTRQADI